MAFKDELAAVIKAIVTRSASSADDYSDGTADFIEFANAFVDRVPDLAGPMAESASVGFRSVLADIITSSSKEDTKGASGTARDAMFRAVQVLLDIALESSERHKDYVDKMLPLMLIEDTLDLLTIEDTPRVFDYIEPRTDRLIQGLESGKGKGLIVLRFCNELLRRLSRAKNTAFCGRVLLFLTSAYPLTERSGVNLRGDFNVDNVTFYDEDEIPPDAMDVDGSSVKERSFYSIFWGLQRFFSNPLSLFQGDNWKTMAEGVERIVKEFSEKVETATATATSSDKKRKDRSDRDRRPTQLAVEISKEAFFPKYLTSRSLFDLQLRDSVFRRQILVQILIVFNFLLILVKKEEKPPSTTGSPQKSAAPANVNKSLTYPHNLTKEQEEWLASERSKIMKILEAIPPNGKNFQKSLTTVITHEKNWVNWKEESCPPFEKEAERLEIKKARLEQSLAVQVENMGSRELTMLARVGRNPPEVVKDSKRGMAAPSLLKFLEPLAEQLNPDGTPADGIEEEYLLSKDKIFNWRAYRMAMTSHFQLFKKLDSIDSAALLKYAKEEAEAAENRTQG
ncbi:THO complex, subunit THOC1 [Zopfochytrium polystomum]|nr:THO complex, subunit THOC1 [Zopfochytrium polystomum]